MRNLLEELMSSIRPKAPFEDRNGDKGWWNSFTSAQPYQITDLDLKIPGWAERKRSLKMAVLSDLHLGSHANDIARMAEIVTKVNLWKPDIVLLLGDFMNTQILGGGRIPPDVIAELLEPLNSGLGTFAVLGNHDWHYDGFSVWCALEHCGITVLENTSKKILDDFGDFWVVGLADQQTREPNIERAFSELGKGEPAIILAHDPATFSSVPCGPYLTLSGHTHGGQIRIPVVGPS